MRTVGLITFLIAACIRSVAAQQPAAPNSDVGSYNLPGKPPYLVAHYLAWFQTPWGAEHQHADEHSPADWTHWVWTGVGPKHDPSQFLKHNIHDIASVVYPLIGPYDSSSPAVIRYHLASMKAAGVSAIAVLWYGPNSDTDKCVPLILDEAQRQRMRVFICYEEKLNFPGYRHPTTRADVVESATADLSYIITTYAPHEAYLKRNGKPVIEQFNGSGTDPRAGNRTLSPQEWTTIFSHLPGEVEYIRQNLDEAYHPLISGAYVWWDPGDYPATFAAHAAELQAAHRLNFFMSMVSPGFNDTGVWGWGNGPRVSKEYGLPVLDKTMSHALEHHPELVQLVTWNDFNEGTCFEPTVQNGSRFLESLGRWWQQSTGNLAHCDQFNSIFEGYRKTCSEAERAAIP
jgi:hypothetical protein